MLIRKVIMARILTGIQSTGTPHLGNILGAIHACNSEMADDQMILTNRFYLLQICIHLTQIKDAETLRQQHLLYCSYLVSLWIRY